MNGDSQARVLVAIMNNRQDMEIARTARWYRVPLKHYRRPLDISYLAFYQTKAFGRRERWAIHYYAPVRSWAIVKRKDLFPDEPWHPRVEEEYFRIEIGPLQRLPRPVFSPRLRRVTFIHTTLEKLLDAREVGDLAR